MAINPFLSFATGALRRREYIRDERAESAGELLDVVSDYFFTQTFPAEQAAIKNDNELYNSISTEYTPQVAEGLYKMGYISSAKGNLLKLKDMTCIVITHRVETKDFFELPRFPINEKYGEIKRFKTLMNTLPFKYKEITPADRYLLQSQNPPNVKIQINVLFV